MKDGFGVSLTSALGLSWGKQNHGEHGKAQCLILMTHIHLQGEGDVAGGTTGMPTEAPLRLGCECDGDPLEPRKGRGSREGPQMP